MSNISIELAVAEEVSAALRAGKPVVALESTLIAHGLPWPDNRETAQEAEAAVRAEGAIPATIAVWYGKPTVGLSPGQLEKLAQAKGVMKASRRDMGVAVGLKILAATTVSATMALAHAAGIRVFATGGIGGAHRPPAPEWDISADLYELARTPVLVVCAGAKSILDLPRTLEILETFGVPVLGYQTDQFPQFFTAGGSLPVSARVHTPVEAAAVFAAHIGLGGGGVVLANPLPEADTVPASEFAAALATAEADAMKRGVSGAQFTPYLLARLAEATNGKTLRANRKLIVNNARLAAQIAAALPLGRID
jgi:pseudouridine-5'-phosphate glycosidase